jgi:predicted amidophosphoribosyltransferase
MIVGKPMANPLDGFYCPECGFNVAADYNDGLCQRCGGDTTTGERIREHCAAVGLHLVTAADKAVLDAAQRWHRLDTSVNSAALHHYCERARLEATP